MKIILILTLSIFLQGCALLNLFKPAPSAPPPQVPPARAVVIDFKALEQCKDLPTDIQLKQFEDVPVIYGNLALLYSECAAKQSTSIKLIKKLGNIK